MLKSNQIENGYVIKLQNNYIISKNKTKYKKVFYNKPIINAYKYKSKSYIDISKLLNIPLNIIELVLKSYLNAQLLEYEVLITSTPYKLSDLIKIEEPNKLKTYFDETYNYKK